MNTRTITAALVAFTMIVMATSPLIDNTNELRPNGIVEFDHGGGVANGTATLGGILTWQDDAWDSTWNCSGGLSLVTPNDWSNFVASGENDPHNYTSWGIALTGAGSYYTEYAPAGEWVVTAGLGCTDDAGEPRAAGGQFGDVHENPPTVNLTNTSTVADVSFTLIEYSEDDYPTFVCDDGEEIPFDWVNDGYEDCQDGSDEPQDYNGDGVTDNWFTCMDGTNISMDLVNDGNYDCPDGDDEAIDFMSIEDIMVELDADGDGNLSLEELIDYVNAEENDETGENISQEEEDMLTDAFNESDADGNGLLDLDELEYLLDLFDEMDNEHTFVCGNGEEIPFDWVNDGEEDCTDGSDEPQDFDGDGVTDNWFDCHDGTNISMDLVNDGNDDCPDGEDEGGHGGDGGWVEFGDAIINATTDVQDDYFENNYNSNWSCDGGVGLMTSEAFDTWNQSGDPYSYLTWGSDHSEEGNFVDNTAPEGMFYVVSGLECEDDTGMNHAYGGVAVDAAGEAELMSFLNGTETLVFITLTSSDFTCNDGTTIPNEWVNDGHGDCPDGEDEDGSGGDFTCNDGTTIPNDWVNDGVEDCPDGEDEDGGGGDFTCNDGTTIPNDWVNDGVEDCPDGEDEDGGGGDYFTCNDGTTIPNELVNDGDEDCPDGEDENGSGEMTFVCGNGEEISFDWVNDGYEDCEDGSDEPQDYDGDGVTDNWFNCMDGSNISMDLVNDGNYDCPDGEDEGVQEAEDDMDCAESGLQMSLYYDAAGDIYFEMTMECAFSQEDSDDMRAMYDMYFGDGDGILNESEAAILIEMMAEEDNSSEEGDDGENWTIDGISVEMSENVGIWDNLADPSLPISMSMTMTTDSIADDGTGTHTVMYVSDDNDDDNGDDSGECTTGSVVSNSDFAPTSVVFTPATQFTIEDNGDYFEFAENPDSTTGECTGDGPESATMVFESIEEEPVDTEPTCAYSWTAATDTSWESESGITLGPDGDVNMTFEPGSYMIAVQCTDAENDVVNASWATADGTLSASETGSGTVFGWVQFTIPDSVTGTMEVEYAWDSTTFGSAGTFTFNFASEDNSTSTGGEPTGTGGGIPGFTSVLTVSALLGAAMILARRKD